MPRASRLFAADTSHQAHFACRFLAIDVQLKQRIKINAEIIFWHRLARDPGKPSPGPATTTPLFQPGKSQLAVHPHIRAALGDKPQFRFGADLLRSVLARLVLRIAPEDPNESTDGKKPTAYDQKVPLHCVLLFGSAMHKQGNPLNRDRNGTRPQPFSQVQSVVLPMQHKDIQYSLVQTVIPRRWK
jgi:hypothetical protein